MKLRLNQAARNPNYCNSKSVTRVETKGSKRYLSGKQFSDSDAELQPRILLKFFDQEVSIRSISFRYGLCWVVRLGAVNEGAGVPRC